MQIRRSNLLVASTDARRLDAALLAQPDAVTLDLGDLVTASRRSEARSRIGDAAQLLADRGVEVLVRLSDDEVQEDLSVALGAKSALSGVVIQRLSHVDEVTSLAEQLTHSESELGRQPGSLEILVTFASPRAVWHAREILSADERIRQCIFAEPELCASLGIVQDEDFDALGVARGRVINEATTCRVQPVGVAHHLAHSPVGLDPAEIQSRIRDSRNLGFKGILCSDPEWVAPADSAFTPTVEQVEHARRVREAFAEGVARGTAAVPLDGRMIDVPVDLAAAAILEFAAACASRDAKKNVGDRLESP